MHDIPFETIPWHNLFDPKRPIIVAMSGGVDSSVLYHVLKAQGFTLVIAHVHHGKRSESDEELSALEAFAKQEGVAFESTRLSLDDADNFHDTARQERLSFYKACAQKYSTDQIALGHHKDDQVETILMRAIAGAPLTTWQGMSTQNTIDGMRYIRPFLNIEKQSLIDVANRNQITYFEDHTNRDDRYTRNRFRHKILPLLKQENPEIETALIRTSLVAKHLDTLLDDHVQKFLKKHPEPIEIDGFKKLNPLVKQRLLTTLMKRYDQTIHLSQVHSDELIRQLETARGNFAHPITDTITLHYEYGRFTCKSSSQIAANFYVRVDSFGRVSVREDQQYEIGEEEIVHKYSNCHTLWYNETVFPLVFRTRRQGDKMLCSYGHKKLKDLFIENKVPPSERDTLTVLANDEEVLWVPFLKMGKAKQPGQTRKIYVCEVPACSTKTSKKR